MMGVGITAELPIVQTIGRLIPLPICRAMFYGIEFLMDYALIAVENSRWKEGNGKNIFAPVLQEAEKENAIITDLDVQMEAYNLIVAGSDTTAVTLVYTTWAIMSHPELRAKLEEEVADLPDDFCDAEVEKLPLLSAAINESLRLYGAVPGTLPRAVPKGGVTLGGYHIPGGIEASTQAWSLHRDPSLFPDPDKYVLRAQACSAEDC
jgi:cytochrome P450